MKILTKAKIRHYSGIAILIAAYIYTYKYAENYQWLSYTTIILVFVYLIIRNRLDTNKFKRRLTKSKLYKR